MNTLGKTLVFFVLVLSLIWNYLVVSAYATRTNYKAELDRTQKLYAEAAKASTAAVKLAEEQKVASDAAIAQLQADLRSTQARVVAAENDSAAQKLQVEAVGKDKEKHVQDAQLLQVDSRQKEGQINILREQVTKLDVKLNAATLGEQKASNEALQARIDRDAANRKSEEYEKRLLDLNDQYLTLRNGGRGGVGIERTPPSDPNFKATVVSVSDDLVEINLGSNAKLQKGEVLDVSRPSEKKYIGKIRIERVDPHGATGRFKPLAGIVKPSTADLPRKGDTVSVIK
ncbi:hypothetical protein [Limnoglobus roseus]|uniref:Chromosome partition protein Smc n=1 Tax=Limnoglobus roseus TaxID=2598579 RepID=A0A5C1AAS4_9BACT|nr:hypothetical protein [Limnoglobus roseus]QEL14224.1 hypothetical protein PX52LOC_01094 [Limnoglobus roseus]